MGIFSAISNWKNARYEQHVENMHSLGKCPDCRGKGITIPMSVYEAAYECPSCNGSGLYSDWAQVNE